MSYKAKLNGDASPDNVKREKRVTLERAISTASEGVERIPMSTKHRKYQTATPAILERWRSSRRNKADDAVAKDRDTIIDDIDEESGDYTVMHDESPPVDDNMLFFESFDDVSGEALRVKIVKDQLRSDLLELMRSNGGNVRVLEEIENGSMTAEVLEQTYGGAAVCTSRLERNIAFLWSAFMKRKDLVEVLLKCGADIDYCEPVEGFSALHLSAFSGCVSCLKFLISKGAKVNYALRNYTPLHSAAFGNSVATAQLLINSGARTDIIGSSSDGVCGTAIHSAIKANSVECVQLLAKYCSDINSVEPTGRAPIHVAADLGHSQCLQVILDVEKADVNVKTKDKKNNGLHLAAESGNSDCIAMLLSRGAEPDGKNGRGQTALHLAAKVQSVECVETLLKTGGCDPNVSDNDKRTALHCAVGRAASALEIVEILVSWRADVNSKDKYGYTPLHIAALNELSQCVESLIYHGADVTARTVGNMTALGIIKRKTPASLGMLYSNLDKAISMNDPEDSSREVELKLDFRSILQHCPNKGEISFLNTLVEEGQKEILQHPLCEAFLHLKWEKIRKFYYCRLFFCMIFVLLFTCYVMTALAHDWYNIGKGAQNSSDFKIVNCKLVNCSRIINCSAAKIETDHTSAAPDNISTRLAFGHEGDFSDAIGRINVQSEKSVSANDCQIIIGTCNSTDDTNDWQLCTFFTSHPEYIELQWCVLMVFALFETFRKFYGLASYPSLRQYFTQFENLVEWFVIVSVFAISCVFAGETYAWQNHVAAFAVLASWINVMFMVGQLPLLGSYVAMYSKVLEEFAKLLLAYVCLLVGFTISFCVIFPSEDKFVNPFISIINILIMMTGEVDMDLLVKDNNSQWLFVSAHIIYVLFLLLVTIVLMNLLVGIAVNDIQGLKKTAGLSKLVRQTQLINYIERAMFNDFVPTAIIKILVLTAMVSPSAYRVVLQVRPLNPREQRLPKEILKSAYELAKSRRKTRSISSRVPSNATNTTNTTIGTKRREGLYQPKRSLIRRFGRQESEVTNLEAELEESGYELERLRGEVQEMKEMLMKNQVVMQSLLEALNKKCSDC